MAVAVATFLLFAFRDDEIWKRGASLDFAYDKSKPPTIDVQSPSQVDIFRSCNSFSVAMDSLISPILTALGWLTGTFVTSLVQKAADSAIQRWWSFGLEDGDKDGQALNKLKDSLLMIQFNIISKVENMWITDERMKWSVNKLLLELKDAAYDADDLLDELQYRALQQQMEQRGDEASNLSSSSSSDIPPRKKIRSTSLSGAIRSPFGKGDNKDNHGIIKEMKETQKRLDDIAACLEERIASIEVNGIGKKLMVSSVSRQTSSFLVETQLFGREVELKKLGGLLSKLEDAPNNGIISVFTIVGIGGVGKTTLVQEVYNKLADNCFGCKFWVCVSENFSVERLTKEMIESTTRKKYDLMNFDTLQQEIKDIITSKRFLLVLDDVWDLDNQKWERFCAPLRCGAPGSKILITTRFKGIADTVGSADPINLDGLDEKSFLEYFEKCTLRSQKFRDYPELEAIAKKNISKLKGLPLAARTLGGLLKQSMEKRHWETVWESEIWKLQQKETDVLPVLQLSYQYLPTHLKRCFTFCSLYPKDFEFEERNLIHIWMAEGFIAPQKNVRMEDIGSNYFRELVSRSFFQQSQNNKRYEIPSKRFPYVYVKCYVIHDLLHDLAQLISEEECCRIEGPKTKPAKIPSMMIRHMSMFDVRIKDELNGYEKLRTFLTYGLSWFRTYDYTFFGRLKRIKVLVLQNCSLHELPETIGNLVHLRYLDISENFKIRKFPESLCNLYNMQTLILDVDSSELRLPHDVSKLINLRHLVASDETICAISEVGKLTSLQELSAFKVLNEHGHKIEELRDWTQLQGTLRILNLENIESADEAREGKLNNKKYLEGLTLKWAPPYDTTNLGEQQLIVFEEVLEALQPHQGLKDLKIVGYEGARSPSWLKAEVLYNLKTLALKKCTRWADLSYIMQLRQQINAQFCGPMGSKFFPMLEKLRLKDLPALEELPNLGQLPCLKDLRIRGIPKLKMVGHGFFGADKGMSFPCLKELHLSDMPAWEEWSWPEDQALFPCLDRFYIVDCPKLKRLPPLPYSLLTCLEIWKVGLTKLPGLCKKIESNSSNATACPSELRVSGCPNLRSLEEVLLMHPLPNIKSIQILKCEELMWLPFRGFKELTSLEKLYITGCPKLMTQGEKFDLLPTSITNLTFDLDKFQPCCPNSLLSSITQFSVLDLKKLQCLTISNFEELKSIEGLGDLGSLNSLNISGCPKLLPDRENKHGESSLSLTSLRIDHTTLLKLPPIRKALPSITKLKISSGSEVVMFEGEDQELLQSLTALESLSFFYCRNLQSLPTKLHTLSSLRCLDLYNCPKVESLPEMGLPTSLTYLSAGEDCHPMLREQSEEYNKKKNEEWLT